MKFRVDRNGVSLAGRLIYRVQEYSFDFLPAESVYSITSMCVNTLQLEIDGEGRVLYAWGYCPLLNAVRTEVLPPPALPGYLISELNEPPLRAVSIPVRADRQSWTVSVNDGSGWICIGNTKTPPGAGSSEFATN